MLRTLESNQPVAWLFVPLSSALTLAVWAEVVGNFPWSKIIPSWLILIASARVIHRTHFASGMTEQPTALPSFTAALVGTVLLTMEADVVMFLGLLAAAFSMRLGLIAGAATRGQTGWMFASAFMAGTAALFDIGFIWGLPGLLLGIALMARLRPPVVMAWIAGGLAPFWVAGALWWLEKGAGAWPMLVHSSQNLPTYHFNGPVFVALVWAGFGLLLRFKNRFHLTAVSRRAQMLTTVWTVVTFSGAAFAQQGAAVAFWFVLFAAWNIPSAVPRSRFWGPAMVYAQIVLTILATLLPVLAYA